MPLVVTLRVRPPLILPPVPEDKNQESITVQPTPAQPATPSSCSTPELDEQAETIENEHRKHQLMRCRDFKHSLNDESLRVVERICDTWGVENLFEFFNLPQGDPQYKGINLRRFIPKTLNRNFVWKLRQISNHCDRDEARTRVASAFLSLPTGHPSRFRPIGPCVLKRVIESVLAEKKISPRSTKKDRLAKKDKNTKESQRAGPPAPGSAVASSSTSLDPEPSQVASISDDGDTEPVSISQPEESIASESPHTRNNPNMSQQPRNYWDPTGGFYPNGHPNGLPAGNAAPNANPHPQPHPQPRLLAPSNLRFSSTPDQPPTESTTVSSQQRSMEDQKARLLAHFHFRSERVRILTTYLERISASPTPTPDGKLDAAFTMVKSLGKLAYPQDMKSKITLQDEAWGLSHVKKGLNTIQALLENNGGAPDGPRNPYEKHELFLTRADIRTEIISQESEIDITLAALKSLGQQHNLTA